MHGMLEQSCGVSVAGALIFMIEHDMAGMGCLATGQVASRAIGYYSSTVMYSNLNEDKDVENRITEKERCQ